MMNAPKSDAEFSAYLKQIGPMTSEFNVHFTIHMGGGMCNVTMFFVLGFDPKKQEIQSLMYDSDMYDDIISYRLSMSELMEYWEESKIRGTPGENGLPYSVASFKFYSNMPL